MEDVRTRVGLTEYKVVNTRTTDFPGNYDGYDDSWSIEKFKEKFKIDIIKLEDEDMTLEFDMIGIDAAIANAFRRILLAEVPSMAIEKVFISNNTSVIQDEVLAHRLGLIPFKADSRLFEYRLADNEKANAEDTLEFSLKIACTKNPNAGSDATTPQERYINSSVYSKHIKWIPLGNQESMYEERDVSPVNGDILIAKLRPGQEIDLKMHVIKGIGQDHAKFSPVATASYRLLPEIILTRPIKDDDAYRLASSFTKGVIEIQEKEDGKYAKVANARMDTCSRNIFRHEDLKDAVKLNKIRDHFIFSVESTGAVPSTTLFLLAVEVLKNKCRDFKKELTRGK